MSDAPKDRDALIELMARARCERLFGPGSADREAGEAGDTVSEWTLQIPGVVADLETLESSGCFVGPVVATYGLDKMSGAGAEAIPAAEGISGYAGQIACRVWTAMQSANPYAAPRKCHDENAMKWGDSCDECGFERTPI